MACNVACNTRPSTTKQEPSNINSLTLPGTLVARRNLWPTPDQAFRARAGNHERLRDLPANALSSPEPLGSLCMSDSPAQLAAASMRAAFVVGRAEGVLRGYEACTAPGSRDQQMLAVIIELLVLLARKEFDVP